MPRWTWYLLLAAVASLLVNPLWARRKSPGVQEVEKTALKELVPRAVSFSAKKGDPAHYEAYGDSSRAMGYCFVTTDIALHDRGYAGPIKALACMDTGGALTGVKVLESRETPAYAHKIAEPAFLTQFKGKSVREKFIIGEDLDGIARASVSGEAVARSVRKSARAVARSYLGIDVKEVRESWGRGLVETGGVALAFALAVVGLYIGKNPRVGAAKEILRWVSLLLGLICLGFILHAFLSINTVVNILLLRIPSLQATGWYLLAAGAVVTTILYGRLYCGWVCPFGAALEIIERVGKILIPSRRRESSADGEAPPGKYIVLWAGVTLFAVTDNLGVLGFEPFTSFFLLSPVNRIALALLLLALASSLVVPRFWCRYLCPVGAGLSLLAGWSPWRLRSTHLCDACGECIIVCPTQSCTLRTSSRAVVFDPHECLLCGACSRACPSGAIVPGPR